VTITTGICAVRGIVLEPLADFKSVDSWHHDVEKNQVNLRLVANRQRGHAILRQ
jgi:hypothetical protein